MWTGNPDMAIAQQHIPRSRAILEEGGLLYNPDWMWHKVRIPSDLKIIAYLIYPSRTRLKAFEIILSLCP